MKKLLALALALVMCLALAACGTSAAPAASSGSAAPAAGSGSAADAKDDKTAANKDDVKIGCILIGDENEGYSYVTSRASRRPSRPPACPWTTSS